MSENKEQTKPNLDTLKPNDIQAFYGMVKGLFKNNN